MGLEERVAVLETKMETAVEELAIIREHTEAIRSSMTKQTGFIAGALAILTPIWLGIAYVGKELFDGLLSK